jgi:RimJ/RimL family protein N-acetyltransferase
MLGNDEWIANWTQTKFGYHTGNYDLAVGVVDDHELVGAVIMHSYNGHDVEVSYYGPKTIDLGVMRKVARLCVDNLGVSRVTVRTARNNKIMTRGIKKLGFEYEGIRHCAYGEYDAVMYGLYGRKLMRLAGKVLQ